MLSVIAFDNKCISEVICRKIGRSNKEVCKLEKRIVRGARWKFRQQEELFKTTQLVAKKNLNSKEDSGTEAGLQRILPEFNFTTKLPKSELHGI